VSKRLHAGPLALDSRSRDGCGYPASGPNDTLPYLLAKLLEDAFDQFLPLHHDMAQLVLLGSRHLTLQGR
jgi:hypothetical protein